MSVHQAQAAAEDALVSPAVTRSIPLQKQYVPVMDANGEKTIAYKTAYFGEVQIGTPAQKFTVVFDTGSGHFVLPTSLCQSNACAKHRRYDMTASTSAREVTHDGLALDANVKERDEVVVSYGTGQVTGQFVEDLVCFGGSATDCVNLRVVVATKMTDDPFSHFAFDGVMGLGLDALRLNPKFSFFGEMVSQHPEMLPQFSVFLSRHDHGESAITFGGHDKSRASSDIHWAPVFLPEMGYWLVHIKQVRIGNVVLDDCASGDCRAVLDTGTSLLGVPKQSARTMHKLLARAVSSEGKDPSEIDCRQLPGDSIDFDLGETTISLPVETYSRPAPIKMPNSTSLFCRSLLLPIDMKAPLGPKIFVWGEPVLRQYLTVFDLAEKRIGFSLARQPQESSNEVRTIGAPQEGSLVAGAPLPGAIGSRASATSPESAEVV